MELFSLSIFYLSMYLVRDGVANLMSSGRLADDVMARTGEQVNI
jgi:hypothetical protein